MSTWGFGGVVGAVVVAVSAVSAAGAPVAGDPEPAAIDAIFSAWKDGTPGAALAVVRDEKIVYSRGYGMANLDHSVPIATNTVFDIGSTSKQFTAACVLLLAEDGKLAITDDVRKYLPELPQYEKPITIAHLLHHTSGLRDYTALMGLGGLSIEPDYTEEFLLEMICRQKGLNFAPGEQFSYTNTGFFLLGEIVRRVSGMPMSKFAKERIFEPLGMKSTLFWDDHTMVVPHRAESYYESQESPGGYALAISMMDNVGDGGIYTTVEDLAKWDANFYHNTLGKGKPEFLDRMQEVGRLNNGQEIGYASGLFIGEHLGMRKVSHAGGWRGFRAEMVRFPEKKLTVICLANVGSASPSSLATEVANLYLGGAPTTARSPEASGAAPAVAPAVAPASEAKTFAMPEADWGKFPGRYRAESGSIWTVTRTGPALAIASSSGLRFAARPVGALEFESTDRPVLARLTFNTDGEGKVTSIRQVMPNTSDVVLTHLAAMPDPAAGLADFEGMYDSEELAAWKKATVADGQLWFTSVDEPQPYALNRWSPNGFSVWGFDAVFTRGSDGKVDGFTMNSQPARGMRFVKRAAGGR